jgi:serine/threonine protein kinase/Tfp pilus assembly protein PilF
VNAEPNNSPAAERLDSLVGQVADEFLARQERGERPDIEEYAARYPGAANPIRDVLRSLRLVESAGGAGFGSDPPARTPDELVVGVLGDFRIVREIGRGGMGIVYEAEQMSLARRVALKVLPYAATMDPKQLQRFKNESRAAASLRHEHIVHVYGVGCERGVHYYAMEFIEGLTLAQIIAAMREPGERGSVSAPCETSATGFDGGEGQGARTQPRSPETAPIADLSTQLSGPKNRDFYRAAAHLIADAADALEHAHSLGIVHRDVKPGNLMVDAAGKVYVADFGLARFGPDAGLTMSGDLLGTLRYMAPEQALARHGLVDHRADIYGLGATLYELLTGRPAVDADERAEILRKIAFEDPVAPRRLDRSVPAELETITLKSLAKNPIERYATASELADDLKRLLDDKPIRAKRPSVRQRLARMARRHPEASGALLLAAGLLLGAAWVWDRQRTLAEGSARVVAVEAKKLQNAGRYPEALAVARRAADLLPRFGDVALRRDVETRVAELNLLIQLEEARLEASAAAGMEFDHAREDRAFALAFAEHGLDLSKLAPEDVAGRIRASAIRAHLVAALDEWAFCKERVRAGSGESLRVIAGQADDDPWRQRLRDPQVRRDRVALERLADEEGVLAQPPANLVLLAGALSRAQTLAPAVSLLRKAQQRHPADFWINFELAFLLYGERGSEAEAVGYLRAALALRPESTGVYNNLGTALYRQGKWEEAAAAYRTAIDLYPGNAQAYNNLGIAFDKQGKLTEAVAAYQKAIDINPDFAEPHDNLGNSLRAQGRLAEAEAAYRRAINHKPGLANAHYNLGILLRDRVQLEEAIQQFRTALKVNPQYLDALHELGTALQQQGRLDEAMEQYRKALALDHKCVDTRVNLGCALLENRQTEEGIREFRRAIEIDPKFAKAHYNLGNALMSGKPDEAIVAYRNAVELDPGLAIAHGNLGIVLATQGRLDEAIQEFRRAIDADPKLMTVHGALAKALLDQGQFTEARQQTQKFLDLLDKADRLRPTALRLLQRCDHLLALDAKLAQVLTGEAQPADAGERLELAWLCLNSNKQLNVAALRFFEQAFADQPALAEDPQRPHRYNAACVAALAGCGRGKDADNLSSEELAHLRKRALAWLRADLAAYGQLLNSNPNQGRPVVQQRMQHWQTDPDLTGVRGPEALGALPESERQEWQSLWEDVAALLRRTQTQKAPPDPRPDR